MQWIYIFIAACMETCWTYSLKYLEFRKIPNLRFSTLLESEGLMIWVPLAGYIVFGIGNIYFFSMAMKQIPTATAFAVWTSVSIVLIKISEVVITKSSISYQEIFFLTLTVAGIIGLKYFSTGS